MTGYNSDQFYNIVGSNKPLSHINELSPDMYSNPEFAWPGRTRKHSANGHWVDKNNLQRGFIRMLSTTPSGTSETSDMAKRRCFFQFNPATIVRNINMREDMANPLLQDPAQFSLPVPGNSTFAFELMFDRSFELNRGTVGGDSPLPSSLANYQEDMLLNGPPEALGVLADLRVLDAIIGLGITADMMNYVRERTELYKHYHTSDTTVGASTSGTGDVSTDSTTTSTSPTDSAAEGFENFEIAFTRNVGNQAFLIPNPVRVLFSSLFMVDGFITSVSLTYLKFSESMVPMQCSVAIQMQALYIGFAKKETYLTWALSQAAPVDETPSPSSNVIKDQEGHDALKSLALTGLGDFRLTTFETQNRANWDTTDYRDPPDAYNPSSGSFQREKWNADYYIGYQIDDGLDVLTNAEEALINSIPYIFGRKSARMTYGFDQSSTATEDPIYTAFTSGTGYIFHYSWDLKITRKLDFIEGEKDNTDKTEILLYHAHKDENASTSTQWDEIRRVQQYEGDNSGVENKAYAQYNNSKWGRGLYMQLGGVVFDEDAIKTQWDYNSRGFNYIFTPGRFKVQVTVEAWIQQGVDGNKFSFYGGETKYLKALEPIDFRFPVKSLTPYSAAAPSTTPIIRY